MTDTHVTINRRHRANDAACEFATLDSTYGLWGEVYEASFQMGDRCTRSAIEEALS